MKSKSFKASTWKIYSLCFSFDYLGSIVLHKFPVQVDILVSAGFSSQIEPVQQPPVSNQRNVNYVFLDTQYLYKLFTFV